jgi:hypothetical protein
VKGSGRGLLFACKADTSNLKMETVHVSEMSVIIYEISWRHIPENSNVLYSFPACALHALCSRNRQYCFKEFHDI